MQVNSLPISKKNIHNFFTPRSIQKMSNRHTYPPHTAHVHKLRTHTHCAQTHTHCKRTQYTHTAYAHTHMHCKYAHTHCTPIHAHIHCMHTPKQHTHCIHTHSFIFIWTICFFSKNTCWWYMHTFCKKKSLFFSFSFLVAVMCPITGWAS